jgi:phosphoribosylformimino-5-aminoimidazole carboxamide ribotide isomerase
VSRFEVIPAIDLRGGRTVRLFQGDYGQETVYSEEPTAAALKWAKAGAPWIHVVDLDGARAGAPQHLAQLKAMAQAVDVPLEFGGGVRDLDSAKAVLAAGAERVIVGTAAVENPVLARELARTLGARLVLGIDARGGMVATRGWRSESTVAATDLAAQAERWGVVRLIYTDIGRDGTLTEPNYASLAEVIAAASVPVIASGGVAEVGHLRRLQALGAEGAIVGKALYEGRFALEDALAAVAGDAE